MLGTLDQTQKKVSIVGGGVSGLLAAYFFKKQGFQVTVFEASSHVGGLIQTKQTPYGLVETAAHSLLVNEQIKKFFEELGVPLLEVNPKSKARFIVRNRKMRRMPLQALELLSTLRHLVSAPKNKLNFESATLKEWGDTYLGHAATQNLLAPFITGVYAATPEELNAKLTFPQLMPPSSSDQKNFSLYKILRTGKNSEPRKKRPQMMTPKYGMQSLIDALERNLKDNIRLNSPIQNLNQLDGNIILCTPAAVTAQLLANEDPTSSDLLSKISYSPLITVTQFFKASSFKKPPHGVGVLIPRNENFRILGCLFNSSAFKNRVNTSDVISLSIMLGGTTDPSILACKDEEILAFIHQDLSALFSLNEKPVHSVITRYPAAIPLYSTHLTHTFQALRVGFCKKPGRILFNNYSGAVSIRGMIDALLNHSSITSPL